jgi:hypothetical protein
MPLKLIHVSYVALAAALGTIGVAIGSHDGTALVGGIVALVACFLPSVTTWFTPKAG